MKFPLFKKLFLLQLAICFFSMLSHAQNELQISTGTSLDAVIYDIGKILKSPSLLKTPCNGLYPIVFADNKNNKECLDLLDPKSITITPEDCANYDCLTCDGNTITRTLMIVPNDTLNWSDIAALKISPFFIALKNGQKQPCDYDKEIINSTEQRAAYLYAIINNMSVYCMDGDTMNYEEKYTRSFNNTDPCGVLALRKKGKSPAPCEQGSCMPSFEDRYNSIILWARNKGGLFGGLFTKKGIINLNYLSKIKGANGVPAEQLQVNLVDGFGRLRSAKIKNGTQLKRNWWRNFDLRRPSQLKNSLTTTELKVEVFNRGNLSRTIYIPLDATKPVRAFQ